MKKKFSIKDRAYSFTHAFRGLGKLLKEEHNSRIHVAAAVIATIMGLLLKINTFEWLAVAIAIALVLLCELFNTAIERLADKVEPNWDKTIGEVKDYASAGVLIASILAVLVGGIIFTPKLIAICGL